MENSIINVSVDASEILNKIESTESGLLSKIEEKNQSIADLSDQLLNYQTALNHLFTTNAQLTSKLSELENKEKESRVPSAEELSQPGALQAYVDTKASKGETVILPPGVIKGNLNLTYYHGVTIKGAGPSHISLTNKNGWRTHPQVKQSYTIIKPEDESKAVIRFKPCMELKLQDFSIDTRGIAIDFPEHRGWGGAHIHLDRVNMHYAKIGFRAGKEKGDHNAADVSFTNCTFDHCDIGLQVNHNQGVNYVFTGLNYFYDCPLAVHLKNGGAVVASSLHGYGVKTWCRMEGGGSNLNPQFYCDFIYSDRSLPSQTSIDLDRPYPVNSPPILLDASIATGTVKAYVGAVKGTWNAYRDGKLNNEHNFILAPSHKNYELLFGHPEVSNLLKQANIEPVHMPNPYFPEGVL